MSSPFILFKGGQQLTNCLRLLQILVQVASSGPSLSSLKTCS